MAKLHVSTTINGEPMEFLCEPNDTMLDALRGPLGLTGSQGRLRVRRLRRLQHHAGRPPRLLLPDARGRGRRPRDRAPSRAWRRASSCIRCSRNSSKWRRCNAASAPRACWSPPTRCCEKNPKPSEEEVRFWLAGNLCRCTGYDKIVRAVLETAADMREQDQESAMNIVTNNKWIGQRTIRPDGVDKVTGRAAFAADTTMPGMIWGKVLRSPHPHARIKSIDTSKAEALPGVKAVVTARDIVDFPLDKSVMLGIQDMRWMCRNVMAREKALFPGHPVAAVAATTEAIAAQGLRADRGRLRSAAVVDRDRRCAEARRADPARVHQVRGQAVQHRRQARGQEGRRRRKASRRPRWSSSAASPRARCIRAISSRTPAWSASPPTTRPRSGARARASSWCAR